MSVRINNNNSINQIQQQTTPSTNRTAQQATARNNSEFQNNPISQRPTQRGLVRSSENISANLLRGQLQASPNLSTFTKDILNVMRPAASGREGLTATATATPNAAIKDFQTTSSTIGINDDLSVTGVNVAVNIDHTYAGDVEVKLKSPSGKEVLLRPASGGRGTGTVNFTANPADFNGESSKGNWTLVVNDKAALDSGTLKSWSLNVSGNPKTPPPSTTITKSVTPNVTIADENTTVSTIDITDEGSLEDLKLSVDIAHPFRGDLVIKLVSPSGKEAILTNQEGGANDDFVLSADRIKDFAFSGESIKGQWKLVVQDTSNGDTGTLKSWGLSLKTASVPLVQPTKSQEPSNILIKGTPLFRAHVAQSLEKLAPGTTMDAKGYVHAATARVEGHEQGYKLLDELFAGGNGNNKKVIISFAFNSAFTSADINANADNQGGTGVGTDPTVSYDPSSIASLPTLQPDGTIKNEPVPIEVTLAHELVHAVHAQRGAWINSAADHIFTDGGTTYKENWRYEELRTTGFGGFRQGDEPSENSIRTELGYNTRAAYLDRSSWVNVNGATPNNSTTNNSNSTTSQQLVGDMWKPNGAALPNGQIRMCNCFACQM